jgi:hypothetical protein
MKYVNYMEKFPENLAISTDSGLNFAKAQCNNFYPRTLHVIINNL